MTEPKDYGPNLGLIKITAIHCYMCGNAFEKSGNLLRTMHHAIPQMFKPKRNFLIPVCKGCHIRINEETPNPYKARMTRYFTKLKKHVESINPHIERMEKEFHEEYTQEAKGGKDNDIHK